MLIHLESIESPEDTAKFEKLYELYKDRMFHAAYQVLQNHHDAEDAVQQAFVSIIENLEKISGIRCPQTISYVVTITERKAVDIIRRNARYTHEIDPEYMGFQVSLPVDDTLSYAMAKLPAKYREALMLRFDCGYSTREMAEILGMKRDSVQKVVWRAKQMLEDALEEEKD